MCFLIGVNRDVRVDYLCSNPLLLISHVSLIAGLIRQAATVELCNKCPFSYLIFRKSNSILFMHGCGYLAVGTRYQAVTKVSYNVICFILHLKQGLMIFFVPKQHKLENVCKKTLGVQ